MYTMYFYFRCVDDVFIWYVRTPARDPEYGSEGGQDVYSQSDFVHTED